MKHSKETIKFADKIVSHYSTYDNDNDCCELSLSDIPDFVIHEMTSLVMLDDPLYAAESTCADNPNYMKDMLPDLIILLRDSTNKDSQTTFVNSWKKNVSSYFDNTIKELLDYRLEIYNQDLGYTPNLTRSELNYGSHRY